MAQALLALLLAASPAAFARASFDHSAWDRVLKSHVNEIGEVNYAALKNDRKDLDEYIRLLAEASPLNRRDLFPSRAHELAYWINAYNAFVVRAVVDRYPTRSVLDLGVAKRFFWRKDHNAGGEKITLLHLENGIIRKQYREPRIHFALVCASVSCPFLSREAFTGENLESQLDHLAREFINQKRNLTIDLVSKHITLSEIFKWYAEDFQPSVVDYLRKYANDENGRALESLQRPKITYHDYDWSINEPGARARARSAVERELSKSKG